MDRSRTTAFFAADGPLARAFDRFERRAEQVELATEVAETMAASGKLMAEAGTGIGKTLAYLVPAMASGHKVMVSTGTKNLQDQLVSKDVPIVERALGIEIDVQVMKGRTNYLCHVRADRFVAQARLPSVRDAALLEAIMAWRDVTQTGDRAELRDLHDQAAIWRELTANSDQCLGRKCRDYERCWVTVMRRHAQSADLVIVNHHLYIADLALRDRLGDLGVYLLPLHELVVFDEAHELDEIAAQHFGYRVSEHRFAELAHDVALASAADPQLGALLGTCIERLRGNMRELFDRLPFGEGRQLLGGAASALETLDAYQAVDETLEVLESELATSTLDEAPGLARRVAQAAAELAFVLNVEPRRSLITDFALPARDELDNHVRYTESSGHRRSLVARPVEVASILKEALAPISAVFVSATLTVDGSFGNYRARLGLCDAHELAVGSPFEYQKHARLYLPTDLPDPDQADFAQRICERAARLVCASAGGAFVLCTSLRMLPIVRAIIERHVALRVLMQGDMPKGLLIDEFKSDGHAVLVATLSFWQGVDVPGAALRLVIIDKLPFASPADPVVAARIDYLRRCGEDPFLSYQVPHAALLVRQGFGRLIRRQSDQGLVAILDRRVVTRRYGEIFLRTLPACPRFSELADAEAFLASIDRGPIQVP